MGGDNKTSQQGQHERTGDVASRERTESGEQSANDSGRTDEDSGSSAFETNRQTENESRDIRTIQTIHQSGSEREGLEQTLDGRRQADSPRMDDDTAGIMETGNDRSDIRVFKEGLATSYREHSKYSERARRTAESERLVNTAKQKTQKKCLIQDWHLSCMKLLSGVILQRLKRQTQKSQTKSR